MLFSRWCASSAILLLLSLQNVSSTQQTAPPRPLQTKAPVQPDIGSVSENVYANEFFRFAYTFPADWHVQNQKEQKQVAEEGHKSIHGDNPEKSEEHQEAMKLTWTLFGAVKDLKAGPTGPSVQIVAFDLKADPTFKNPAEVLSGIGETLETRGAQFLQKPTESSIAGRKFFTMKMKITDPDATASTRTIYYAASMTLERGYALAWFLFSDSPSSLEELLGTLNQVKFKNSAN